ncbi:hypothetical protein [Hafnia alvei]|nr:hypothetical protein [Hafnia alvei]
MRNAVRLNLAIIVFTLLAAALPLKIIPVIGNMLSVVNFGSPYISKIIGYINSPIAYFYDLNMLGRLPLIVAALVMLIVTYLYRKVIPEIYYKVTIILMLYCLFFLEMSYSFRNYYWVLPILPFLMANIPAWLHTSRGRRSAIIIMTAFHLILSITGYYTSGIMALIFI